MAKVTITITTKDKGEIDKVVIKENSETETESIKEELDNEDSKREV